MHLSAQITTDLLVAGCAADGADHVKVRSTDGVDSLVLGRLLDDVVHLEAPVRGRRELVELRAQQDILHPDIGEEQSHLMPPPERNHAGKLRKAIQGALSAFFDIYKICLLSHRSKTRLRKKYFKS